MLSAKEAIKINRNKKLEQEDEKCIDNDFKNTSIHPLMTNARRDVILINPFCHGGGDSALGEKIAQIATEEGCRVKKILVDVCRLMERKNNIFSWESETYHVSQMNNPAFIIAPINIVYPSIAYYVSALCDKYNFHKKDIILIAEMDTKIDPSLHDEFKSGGFENIKSNMLGFSDGAIGYIPMSQQEIDKINKTSEAELLDFMSGYSVSLTPPPIKLAYISLWKEFITRKIKKQFIGTVTLPFTKENSYHLSYISSSAYSIGSQRFILNTLSETLNHDKETTFIMITRQIDNNPDSYLSLFYDLKNRLLFKDAHDFNNPALFEEAKLFFLNSENNKIESIMTIKGDGRRKVNIIITKFIPKNIFQDFMLLCDSGVMSGDQSFSEFLSIKKKLPYYDMQSWKKNMVKAIKKHAGKDLEGEIDRMIIKEGDEDLGYTHHFIPNARQPSFYMLDGKAALDKKISSFTATSHIKNMIREII